MTVCVRRGNGAVLPDPMDLYTKPLRDRAYLSRGEFAREYGAAPEDIAKVVAFGESRGLVEIERSIARRLVVLSGTVEKASAAFGPQLLDDLASIVDGVFGLDNRKMARAHTAPASTLVPAASRQTPPWAARHYNFPAADGTGQTIGLIEFGNNYDPADIRTFFAKFGLQVPVLSAVNLGGATPGTDPPDSEATLDIDVAGSVAPGARIVVYFAPWTEQGWIQAVGGAIHDAVNAPSVLSISWGCPELQQSGGPLGARPPSGKCPNCSRRPRTWELPSSRPPGTKDRAARWRTKGLTSSIRPRTHG